LTLWRQHLSIRELAGLRSVLRLSGQSWSDSRMSLRDFLSKQFIDVIEWVEPEDGILAYRYPMQDREIQNGGKLTVRDSQMAVFVNEGRVADVFGPGLYTLNTNTLPILTYLMNWDKAFKSPFKSDVYFFVNRLQTNQHWGTPNPITIRDKEFGAVRLRAFGIYAYHLADPKLFYTKVYQGERYARCLSGRRP
jgi:membrane protease subunit (stomatin/prohibitin family)